MKELTKAEEQIMQILWNIEKGFVKDIIQEMPKPKPAYNTVSTIVRILEKKGFIDHKAYGNTHEYFPLIGKEEYTKKYFNNFLSKYFGSSFKQMVSFFANDNELSVKDMEEIRKMLKKQIKEKDDK